MAHDPDLRAWRLESQWLLHPGGGPREVVERLCGVQAQEHRWAEWSIGLRSAGSSESDVEQSIRTRQVVRTWMFRGTLHFVAARDFAWLAPLLAPGVIKGNARRYRELELDDEVFARSDAVLVRALEEDGSLTRAEIKTRLQHERVPSEGQQVPYLLQHASLLGLVCQGVRRGSEPTYVLASRWIHGTTSKTTDRGNALALLAERYFTSRGPATRQDFAWWSGLSASEAGEALEGGLESIEVGGTGYWAGTGRPATSRGDRAHLLPSFDEYLLGYKERGFMLDEAYVRRVNAGGGIPKPTVIANGEVVGTWSYEPARGTAAVSIELFRSLRPRERAAVERAVGRLGDFRSEPAELRLSPARS